MLGEIPRCHSISASGGLAHDNNTISEGRCTLPNGTYLTIYVWAAGDTSDQHNYVHQHDVPCQKAVKPGYAPNGCIIGSSPTPWFAYILTSGGAPGYATEVWNSVTTALNGRLVTNIPAS